MIFSSITAKKGRRSLELPGTVEILSPGLAVRQADEEHTAAKQEINRLVFWTDGSAGKMRNRGLAVAWRRSTEKGWGRWETVGYKAIGQLLDSSSTEVLAVIK